ncbi:MAG: dienelactone hydrolase family protein, partial [Candidatus Aminicenantes bacterium]|nr:dienelactone hydrolase family protein [Candidatus Aminicenantes bacterium]
ERAVKNASEDDLEKARIKVERIDCPVMLISGTRDELGPTTEWSETIADTIREKKPSSEVLHLNYDGAGHAFFLPNLPPTKLNPAIQVRDVALAERDAWKRVLEFLDKHAR